jgi:iron(III) transport system ATP-binding protein
MTAVHLRSVTRLFGATVAVDDVTLDIPAGELFFLLGPSGCGKSTLLRIVAGLQEPTQGRVLFGSRDVTEQGTEQRNAVMVFQSYALWPHMSVRDNVRFGLEVRHTPRADQERRVAEVLRLVQMEELAQRKPNQLSGGQQQRVALARALAVSPDCLLLDEPLSNLDAKLRQEMRSEIRRICKATGFTTIYVTHDQKEALSVADRIGIMRSGKLVQVGTPGELYRRPGSTFVADFIGQTNLLPGRVVGRDGPLVRVETSVGTFRAVGADSLPETVTLSIRPEQMQIARDTAESGARNRVVGRCVETTFLGESSEHVLMVNGQRLKVIAAPPQFDVPEQLAVEFDPDDVVVLPE